MNKIIEQNNHFYFLTFIILHLLTFQTPIYNNIFIFQLISFLQLFHL